MAAKSEAPRDPVRRWTLIILGVIVALYLYSIIADRMTPYTSQATVQAFIVRMAPEVAGRVQEVLVADNQKVKAGDILFRIDPQTYEIALKQADAHLANVGQTIGANTAAVAAAQERLIEAQAKREHIVEQSNRTLELVKKGVYSEARRDLVLREIDVAEASVREAVAKLAERGCKLVSEVSKVGAKWLASVDNPRAAGADVQEFGFKHVVSATTREAVDAKVRELLDMGATLVQEAELADGVWTAVCEKT